MVKFIQTHKSRRTSGGSCVFPQFGLPLGMAADPLAKRSQAAAERKAKQMKRQYCPPVSSREYRLPLPANHCAEFAHNIILIMCKCPRARHLCERNIDLSYRQYR